MSTREQAVIKAAKRMQVKRVKSDYGAFMSDVGKVVSMCNSLAQRGAGQSASASSVWQKSEIYNVSKAIRGLMTQAQTFPEHRYHWRDVIMNILVEPMRYLMGVTADLDNIKAGKVANKLQRVGANLAKMRDHVHFLQFGNDQHKR